MFQSIENLQIYEDNSMRRDKICFNSSANLIDNICFRLETIKKVPLLLN